MNEETLFNAGNILDGESLFGDTEEPVTPETPQDQEPDNKEQKKETKQPTENFNPDSDLFGEDDDEEEPGSESVGEEDKDKTGTGAEPTGSGSSPKGFNPYSSFAKALYGDGLFQNLKQEEVDSITDAEGFGDAIEAEVNSRLDEKTKRIAEALEGGVSIDEIKQYETTIQQLNGISEEKLSEKSERAEKLRASLIRQDYLTRGLSEARADREVQRSLNGGTDIDDAKDALQSLKEFYENKFETLTEAGRQEAEQEKKRAKEEAEQFKKAVLETEKIFGDIPVDRPTRQKAYELMTKVVRTTEDGERLTAVQLYADEHPVEFRTMLGFVAALTDNFSKMGNLFNKTVDKKVRQNLANIEKKVTGSSHRGGTISFAEGEDEEPESPRGRFVLDI